MSEVAHIITLSKDVPQRASGVLPLDKIESPILRQGADYWKRLRGNRQYPSRAEIVPRDLKTLLRHVLLLRLVDGGADYEYRIVGDAHVVSHGFNLRGLNVSDVDGYSPGYGKVLKRMYDRAVRKRDVYGFRGWMERGEKQKQYIYCESVLMPLGPDADTIDHVLSFSVYVPRDRYES